MAPIAAALAAPVRVAVCGRRGVGRRTLARALAGRWRIVDPDPHGDPDIAVVAFAEAVKPEDTAEQSRWRRRGVPIVVVRTKADLGAGPSGLACAALLADVDLDDELLGALRTADLRSVERDVRRRLLHTLDRHGTTVCVDALQRGAAADGLRAVLREASGIDAVHRELGDLTATVRYRRARAAVTALHAVALRGDPGDVIADFLAGDELALATMGAAVDVLAAAGLSVDPGDSAHAHLRRAVRWRTYSRGPVSPLHRACGLDVCRGSLRLLGRSGR
ncbi:hypothetical protein [Mycolicibacterium sp. F2034L]|uniref:hypothetical protein n=1 Tax=Mycolicibacterium sp. F2034L TaxID=2926422 RepID=UPI001FF67469|nr:hypothetical protein [Mycolicibacterium sp. F2034L]MCK0177154.1 hypothetical protein [Mycolicibacterium sp. F2034L]